VAKLLLLLPAVAITASARAGDVPTTKSTLTPAATPGNCVTIEYLFWNDCR
jgi:hypothetical protein